MTRPLIAIPGRRSEQAKGHRTAVVSGGRLYADAVERAGGLPVYVPPTDDIDAIIGTVDRCDGMVLLGGGDVDPATYGRERGDILFGTDRFIDDFEIAAVRRAVERDIPVLAVCRGHQVLNVALGGTLVQHLDTTEVHRDTMHRVDLVDGSRVARAMGTTAPEVHSFHHQAVDSLGTGLIVTGTFHDGTIESIELDGADWIVGVQWHPEDTAMDSPENQGLFDELVRRCAR